MARQPARRTAASEQIDQQLARAALDAIRQGRKPTRQEQAALRRVELVRDQQQRAEHFAAITQKEWRTWSGRPAKVINEQAATYGIPFDGATINLPAVVRALHDFLARARYRLASDDPLLDGASQSLKDAYIREQIKEKAEKAKLARLDRLEREGALCAVGEMHAFVSRTAAVLRGACEAIRRVHGQAPVDIINDALDDLQREVDAAGFAVVTEAGDAACREIHPKTKTPA